MPALSTVSVVLLSRTIIQAIFPDAKHGAVVGAKSAILRPITEEIAV